jgi:hypothetical protein
LGRLATLWVTIRKVDTPRQTCILHIPQQDGYLALMVLFLLLSWKACTSLSCPLSRSPTGSSPFAHTLTMAPAEFGLQTSPLCLILLPPSVPRAKFGFYDDPASSPIVPPPSLVGVELQLFKPCCFLQCTPMCATCSNHIRPPANVPRSLPELLVLQKPLIPDASAIANSTTCNPQLILQQPLLPQKPLTPSREETLTLSALEDLGLAGGVLQVQVEDSPEAGQEAFEAVQVLPHGLLALLPQQPPQLQQAQSCAQTPFTP